MEIQKINYYVNRVKARKLKRNQIEVFVLIHKNQSKSNKVVKLENLKLKKLVQQMMKMRRIQAKEVTVKRERERDRRKD